ncbi:MAG TPA: hypothetical protein DCS42_12935 [Nitrospiraceae bacterium]|nr:hypothetical protein [Nitrospiraceae bacterium]
MLKVFILILLIGILLTACGDDDSRQVTRFERDLGRLLSVTPLGNSYYQLDAVDAVLTFRSWDNYLIQKVQDVGGEVSLVEYSDNGVVTSQYLLVSGYAIITSELKIQRARRDFMLPVLDPT